MAQETIEETQDPLDQSTDMTTEITDTGLKIGITKITMAETDTDPNPGEDPFRTEGIETKVEIEGECIAQDAIKPTTHGLDVTQTPKTRTIEDREEDIPHTQETRGTDQTNTMQMDHHKEGTKTCKIHNKATNKAINNRAIHSNRPNPKANTTVCKK